MEWQTNNQNMHVWTVAGSIVVWFFSFFFFFFFFLLICLSVLSDFLE